MVQEPTQSQIRCHQGLGLELVHQMVVIHQAPNLALTHQGQEIHRGPSLASTRHLIRQNLIRSLLSIHQIVLIHHAVVIHQARRLALTHQVKVLH